MMTFTLRRWYNLAILIFFSLLSLAVYTVYTDSLRATRFISGWALFLLILLLALYHVRKKLLFLPLIDSSTWLQFHIYAGFFTIVLFVLHIEFRIPNGKLEVLLSLLYLAVMGSGLVGLIMSRIMPAGLTTHGGEVIFERIPLLQKRLREQLDALISQAILEADSTTLADFYTRRLISFFAAPRHFLWHLVQSNRPRYALLNELEALDRYVNAEERRIKEEMADLIRIKDDLDYQYAHQAMLKYWLFVHVPLTYSLLLVALIHGTLAHAFSGRI
jgi:hypothetical protein